MTEMFTLFSPGEYIDDCGFCLERQATHTKLSVSVPARVHISPVDCNAFAIGEPGGGGIGFAVDVGNTATITLSTSTTIATNIAHAEPVIQHFLEVGQAVFGSDNCYDLDIHFAPIMSQHFGLGSSVAIACTVLQCINLLHGSPLSNDQLRLLVAKNFVEELDGQVTRGLETGVGTSVILGGGISVVAGELVEVYRGTFPADCAVGLIDPRTVRPNAHAPECLEMLSRSRRLDASYRYIKSYDILMRIIPALHRGAWKDLGEAVWEIQYAGTHLSMIQSYEGHGRKIYDVLAFLRDLPAYVSGLSSVGQPF